MTAPSLTAPTIGATRLVTLAERPDLAPAIPRVLASRWPRFMLAGQPGHDVDLTGLVTATPAHQVLLLGAANSGAADSGAADSGAAHLGTADEVLGVGLSVPLRWDGTAGRLPAGWDGAVTAGAELRGRGGTPTAVAALSVTLSPDATGRGLVAAMIVALREAAARAGVRALIAPVRPVLKARYPLTPMTDYLGWRTADGQIFDPCLRLHVRLGGTAVGIAHRSMTITGSVQQWRRWAGLPMPSSGEYVIPGGLVPLVVDRDAGTGTYREPNVWVVHRTAD